MRQTTFLLIATGFLGILSLGSCKKYLQVPPQGQYTSPQVFSNEIAVEQALNGLYNILASDSLYGASLTETTVELLAQQYYVTNINYTDVANYLYANADVELDFTNIWQTAYANILAANVFIQGVQGAVQANVVTAAHGRSMEGEALAIRAMLHFDMLRIFGPVFSTGASGPAIPYYRRPDGTVQPILSGTQALDSVLADLAEADSLLSADPVITGGPNIASGVSPDFYAGDRNQRLNYYAVKALMARAYLYGGLTTAAHDSALAVINGASQWFPWAPYSNIIGNTNPDRLFSPEILFGVYSVEMYAQTYINYFGPDLTSNQVIDALSGNLANTFENNENDYRYETTWINGPLGQPNFYKYAPLTLTSYTWQYIQPLIRKSEMYYILAETDPNQAEAFGYLDSVRYNRGLPNLASTAVLSAEIQKEYQKEFIGEGQLFYFYKRNNIPYLPSALSTYGYAYPVYQVPLPLSETTPR